MAWSRKEQINLIEVKRSIYCLSAELPEYDLYQFLGVRWENLNVTIITVAKDKVKNIDEKMKFNGLKDLKIGSFLVLSKRSKKGNIHEFYHIGPIERIWKVKEGSESIIM